LKPKDGIFNLCMVGIESLKDGPGRIREHYRVSLKVDATLDCGGETGLRHGSKAQSFNRRGTDFFYGMSMSILDWLLSF